MKTIMKIKNKAIRYKKAIEEGIIKNYLNKKLKNC